MARKKKFQCGHKGLGQFCHRCQQAEEALKLSGDKKALARMAKGDDTDGKILSEFLKSKAEKLKAVPQKQITAVVATPM